MPYGDLEFLLPGEGELDRGEFTARRAQTGTAIPIAVEVSDMVWHGADYDAWTVAEQCWAEGLRPTTISTDIWTSTNVGPCYDLPTCMTKMLAVGMSLVRASHWLDGATAA